MSDDKIEALDNIFGETTTGETVAEESLPDEEPPEEEIEAIEEDLDEIKKDAPGVDEAEDEPADAIEEAMDEEDTGDEVLDELFGETDDPDGSTDRQSVLENSDQFEKLEEKAKKESKTFDRQAFNETTTLVASMKDIADTRSELAFDQADLMRAFNDRKGWETLGYDSFSKFFRSDEAPIKKSTAYRYKKVGNFMDDFPIGEESFDEQFYKDFDEVDKKIVRDEDGDIDREKTREVNNLRRRLRFTHVKNIAALFDNDDITHARARELMRKSLNMSPSDFDEEIDKHKEGRDNTITEELNDRGVSGPSAIVPLGNKEMAINQLREIADSLEKDNDLFNEILNSDHSESLGSKSVQFIETQDGDLYIDV